MSIHTTIDYPMSWKPDRSELKRPVYLSLAEKLEKDILTGVLAPGTKLPPQRELAAYLGMNFTTVTRAYQICEEKGLLQGRTGSGTFVAPSTSRDLAIALIRSGGSIDLASESFFEGFDEMIKAAAKKAAGKKYFSDLIRSEDPPGPTHHRQAGADWLEDLGLPAEADRIAVVSGDKAARTAVLLGLFSPGDRIAVDPYTCESFIETAKLCRVDPVPVTGDEEGMDAEELDRLCQSGTVRGVFLTPSGCGPGGTALSPGRKDRLAEVIEQNGLILIEDEPCAFPSAELPADSSGSLSKRVADRSVYICGTSALLSPGLKAALMVFGKTLKDDLLQAAKLTGAAASGPDAEILTELLTSGRARAIADEKKRLLTEAAEIFNSVFPEAPVPGNPLSLCRQLPLAPESLYGRMEGPQCEQMLQEKGVRVCHSHRFQVGTDGIAPFLRISLTAASPEQLRMGLEILKQELTR